MGIEIILVVNVVSSEVVGNTDIVDIVGMLFEGTEMTVEVDTLLSLHCAEDVNEETFRAVVQTVVLSASVLSSVTSLLLSQIVCSDKDGIGTGV